MSFATSALPSIEACITYPGKIWVDKSQEVASEIANYCQKSANILYLTFSETKLVFAEKNHRLIKPLSPKQFQENNTEVCHE